MCDDQQNLKDILDAAIVYTPEEVTDFIPSLRKTPTTVKERRASKSLGLFTNIFYAKNKTAKRRVGSTKQKLRAVKVGDTLWTN